MARDISDKGYCSTKSTHYYGVKLHVVAKPTPGALPVPEFVGLTPASTHDLTVIRPILHKLEGKALFGDKIYADQPLNERLHQQKDSFIYTPVKLVKGESEQERQRKRAADNLFSKSVFSIRQPTESLFNWLIEKTNMQNGSKIRSKAGIMVHVFGKLAAACFLMFINP
ncbi:transposase [Catalinimonas niigatensis]|uniref:transposase n=1 Tax=Catalinimonas niigatensis TaxID=1397264 RepID=UPI002665327B|nr:transposase [Catalinimonas niigatensis]WPP48699.1 transposase [Catalinimonas niigatensis]